MAIPLAYSLFLPPTPDLLVEFTESVYRYGRSDASLPARNNKRIDTKSASATIVSPTATLFISNSNLTATAYFKMKDTSASRQSLTTCSRADSMKPYPRGKPASPKKRLAVGGELPALSPEQQVALQNQLLPDRTESFLPPNLTIAQLRQMSRAEGQLQTENARLHTASKSKKKRGPTVPAPITDEQRARGRLLRYISLYENEYREEILEYMYKMQEVTQPSRTAMEQQIDIDLSMRPSLIDFMIELHNVFHLRQETLYLGINILDRYCSRRTVWKKHYQLVGCTALWIAAKFEDSKDHVPTAADLKQYCRDVYEETSFIQMEGHVLQTIEWQLGHPTCEAWFRCMVNTLDRSGSQASKEMAIRQGWVGLPELETHGVPVIMADLSTQCIARYFMEVMIYQDALIDVPPCVIAEAALILSKRSNESPAALHVARYMHDQLSTNIGSISQTVFNKYKESLFERASTIVTQFYLVLHGDALKYLEDLPDVEEAFAIKQEEGQDVKPAVEDAIVKTEDDAAAEAGIGFADSGYASVGDEHVGACGTAPSSPVKDVASKDAPAAARLPPSPSSKLPSSDDVSLVKVEPTD
ncbi:16404_t:CDS:2 [Acaulospora colombiana]|uniref:16404_t:CDS:1 n=1 Tax=Acaulospora colombiana TaxID=27376 RepID=A0ACA9MWV3_9GLOM|nr:16404_t:CDS:2 [Acaulospora colombiana]